ncbi:MAG: ATP synthase F1 subunit delta [Candidatus Omnitrophica bacterium CG1_02_46_14]|nr:MAG: ATP synthase F1 subunit delta [Candidatus Omnitrophica bacterium CG1_02_46_14]
MKDILAATRYAQALFEISILTHRDEEFVAELEAFSKALKQSPALEMSFKNPRMSLEQKRKFLGEIYQKQNHEIYETLLNFFMVLFEKHRFYLIHEIAENFKRITDESKGRSVAEIHTAVLLDAQSEAAIVTKLERMAGHKITVKNKIDPSLIGGVMIKLKNKIMDGSVKNRLHLLTKELMKLNTI